MPCMVLTKVTAAKYLREILKPLQFKWKIACLVIFHLSPCGVSGCLSLAGWNTDFLIYLSFPWLNFSQMAHPNSCLVANSERGQALSFFSL